MSGLLGEVQAMQNPALGAALITRFASSYHESLGAGAPVPAAFIVLPVLMHARTRQAVSSTRANSGMRKFEEKFDREGDVLLALNERALAMRGLSLRSLRIALAARLLVLDASTATVWPGTEQLPRGVKASVTDLLKSADKLGAWCAPLTMHEVSAILRVEF
jgi:hypothetical protein